MEPIAPLDEVYSVVDALRKRLCAAIVGRDDVIDLVINALLSDGHVLLEDYPGSGKTTLAKALGEALIASQPGGKIASMRRVQFTPDLLPSDVTGCTIFDPDERAFHFRAGPIFSHVLLADEINRTSPKVQAALLEAMAEKQCTVDNQTHRLDDLFFVIATQNPLDLAGTFPLPTAQLDRFMFKIRMHHIDMASEVDLLMRISEIRNDPGSKLPLVNCRDVISARIAIEKRVHIAPAIKQALVTFADATRNSNAVLQGVSTRSLVLCLSALQTRALMMGRDYVIPSDIEHLAPFIFAHRLMIAPGGGSPEDIVVECLKTPLEMLAKAKLN